ncbi:MAG: PEGA domain-containing protein [Calditrichia bacterium]
MRHILFFLLIALLILPLSAQDNTDGFLTVDSNPDGCWVRVDSLLVGKTPLQRYAIPAGAHRIQIYPPQTGIWNLQERNFDIEISAGAVEEIRASFSRPVLINSLPYGAQVYQDTTKLGITPLSLSFEQYAGKSLQVSKSGYAPHKFVLNEPIAILARLEKNDSFVEEAKKPQLLGVIPKRHVKSKFSLLALSVASHWAAFHFKNVADSNFDKYQLSGDPASRDRLFDNTQRYDRFSEISLGVSYASLAGLIYMVIWK